MNITRIIAATSLVLASTAVAPAQTPLFTMICKDYANGEILPSVPRDQGISCPDPSELVLQDEAGYEIRVERPKDDGRGAGPGFQLRVQDPAGREIDTSQPKDGTEFLEEEIRD